MFSNAYMEECACVWACLSLSPLSLNTEEEGSDSAPGVHRAVLVTDEDIYSLP